MIYSFKNVKDHVVNHKWHFLASPQNYLTVTWIIAGGLIIDLSNFFNKAVLNITSSHFLLKRRIFIVGFLTMTAAYELYDYTRAKYDLKKVPFSWILLNFIVVAEGLLFLRNYPKGFFSNSAPLFVKQFWLGLLIIFLMGLAFSIRNSHKKILKN